MGKGTKAVTELITSLRDLRLALESLILRKYFRDSFSLPLKKTKPPSLVSLCLEILGQNLEDIIADISKIAAVLPSDIKLALVAIARRRQLLNDDLLVALAEVSWKILDIYGSNVTDYGLKKVVEICTNLQAVDISHCDKITATGVSGLICHCQSLEILRWGGSPRSDSTAFRCVDILKPKLNNVEEESWEELENADIGSGAPSLRWLVWPNIDEVSKAIMAAECPQIIVNPPVGFPEVPNEALDFVALDYSIIDGIDPKTWDVSGTARSSAPKLTVSNETFELFIADFLKRRATLVPKQAIYERQNKRRAKREYLMSSSSPKSIMRASQASKFLHHRR